MLTNEPLQLDGVAQLMPLHALPDAVQNLLRGANSNVGRDESELQLVQQVGIDLFLALQSVFQGIHQPRARLLDAALQFFKERRLLLNGAE